MKTKTKKYNQKSLKNNELNFGLEKNNSWGIITYYFKSYSAIGTPLTFSWRRRLSYRNQSIDLQSKSMDWLYDNDFRHERVKEFNLTFSRKQRFLTL